jgi:hypothetical protein
MYSFYMTQAVSNLLREAAKLSPAEQRELRLAIAENIPMSADLTDDDFAALAAASFRALDAEEDNRRA